MMPNLAVVIPAYKEKYFHRALQSLADQTCKDFTVYIGDDASPSDLRSVADLFTDRLNIFYTRFDTNTGSRNLVNQWKRCVALSRDEQWLWLFSDDDIADPACVENFYSITGKNKDRFDVYRFNTDVIDKDGNLLFTTPVGPPEESSERMAYHLLMGERGNSMPDHIFARKVYNEKGGFVFTEYAQGADWATSISFSADKGLAIIPGAIVHWRYSGFNISSTASKQKNNVVRGHLQFLQWVMAHFRYLQKSSSDITYRMIEEAVRTNLKSVFIHHYKGLNLQSILLLSGFMRRDMKMSFKDIIADLRTIDVYTGNHLQKLSRIKTKIRGIFRAK